MQLLVCDFSIHGICYASLEKIKANPLTNLKKKRACRVFKAEPKIIRMGCAHPASQLPLSGAKMEHPSGLL